MPPRLQASTPSDALESRQPFREGGDPQTVTIDSNSINPKSVVHGLELRADIAIQGLLTALPPSVTQLVVGGVTYLVPDLVRALQGAVQPWKDAREAHAVIRAVMASRPVDHAHLVQFLSDVRDSVKTVVGSGSETLTQFGFKPKRSRKPMSPEKKALAVAKAKLTRAKRNTLGKRQKEALGKAEISSVVIHPTGEVTITPAGAPSPTDQQASAAPPAS